MKGNSRGPCEVLILVSVFTNRKGIFLLLSLLVGILFVGLCVKLRNMLKK